MWAIVAIYVIGAGVTLGLLGLAAGRGLIPKDGGTGAIICVVIWPVVWVAVLFVVLFGGRAK